MVCRLSQNVKAVKLLIPQFAEPGARKILYFPLHRNLTMVTTRYKTPEPSPGRKTEDDHHGWTKGKSMPFDEPPVVSPSVSPHQWWEPPNLMNTLMRDLRSQQVNKIMNGLYCLDKVCIGCGDDEMAKRSAAFGVLSVMQRYPATTDIQRVCCETIMDLVSDQDSVLLVELGFGGAMMLTLKALVHHGPQLALPCLSAIGNLLVKCQANASDFMALDGIHRVCVALDAHGHDAGIQQEGLRIFENLLELWPQAGHALLETATPRILVALGRHATYQDIGQVGNKLLKDLRAYAYTQLVAGVE